MTVVLTTIVVVMMMTVMIRAGCIIKISSETIDNLSRIALERADARRGRDIPSVELGYIERFCEGCRILVRRSTRRSTWTSQVWEGGAESFVELVIWLLRVVSVQSDQPTCHSCSNSLSNAGAREADSYPPPKPSGYGWPAR